MAKSHLSSCPHVFNNAHPGSWSILSKCFAVMPRQTYMQTYIHTYEPQYALKCDHESNSLGPSFIHKFFLWYFFPLHTNGKRCSQEGSHPCYSQSQVVYAYHILSLSLQGFVWLKYHFWAWHENRNGCGHIHVLKIFPRLYWFQIYMVLWF